jgi:nucleoside-diphosphate-sugar epimerase
MSRLLITGATGFVGRILVETALLGGNSVRAVVRRAGALPEHPQLHQVEVADLDRATDWREALDGIETILHVAGRAHVMKEREADAVALYRRTNTEATERLARSALEAGVRRMVFVSSVKVHGERTEAGHVFRASDAVAPRDPYGTSKWHAEQALFEIARGGLEAVVVRPPLVYGAGVRANFLALMRLVDSGFPLPLGAVDNERSLVSVWNLVDLLLTCAEHPAAAGQIFLAADEETVGVKRLVELIAGGLGRSPRLLAVPVPLLHALGTLLGRGAQVGRLCDSLRIDSAPARELLGWKPPLSLETGLQRTVDWYRATRAGRVARTPVHES